MACLLWVNLNPPATLGVFFLTLACYAYTASDSEEDFDSLLE